MIAWLLLGCGAGLTDRVPDDTAAAEDLAATLPARGPHEVGYRVGSVTYPDPAGSGDRTLRLAMWYPTPDTTGEQPLYDGLYISQGAFLDATVDTSVSAPLAVFSHGHQGYAENSSFLMEHLASHGWIVAAPDHTGNTTFDGSDRTTAIYYQRPLDISAVLDALEGGGGLSEELGSVPAQIAAGPVFAMGHSFGGYTMFPLAGATYDTASITAVCASGKGGSECTDWDEATAARFDAGFADDRIVAAVAMAPGNSEMFGVGLATEDIPFLHMTGTEDQPPGSAADFIWSQLAQGVNLRVVLVGAGHQSFTDFADQMEDVTLDREQGFAIVRAYVLAYARRWQLGDDTVDPLLDGQLTLDPAVELSLP